MYRPSVLLILIATHSLAVGSELFLGFLLMLVGSLLNRVVCAKNGGLMPVPEWLFGKDRVEMFVMLNTEPQKHCLMTAHSRLPVFCDVLLGMSIGDICIFCGIGLQSLHAALTAYEFLTALGL